METPPSPGRSSTADKVSLDRSCPAIAEPNAKEPAASYNGDIPTSVRTVIERLAPAILVRTERRSSLLSNQGATTPPGNGSPQPGGQTSAAGPRSPASPAQGLGPQTTPPTATATHSPPPPPPRSFWDRYGPALTVAAAVVSAIGAVVSGIFAGCSATQDRLGVQAAESANSLTSAEIAQASAQASSALDQASEANELAKNNSREQRDAYARRYADLVVISTRKLSTDDQDRQLTVRNIGRQRITKAQLEVKNGATVIRIINVKGCHSSQFVIDQKWFEQGTVTLVFQDADGRWWSRAEGDPVRPLTSAPRRDATVAVDEPSYRKNETALSYDLLALVPFKESSRGSECPG